MAEEFGSKIIKIRQETSDVKTFRFEAPDFTFAAGQFIMLGLPADKTAKPFSISPADKGFIEITKKITGHEFSQRLDALKEGDTVRIKGPYGVNVQPSKSWASELFFSTVTAPRRT